MVREMIGGCCVCLDERGWNENPLVYCDGSGCNVAVHQACYGIVKVPSGPWFCCKCRSQERIARVKCELCPNKEGALKRTDSGGWAHVVCALYIPEVRFGDVGTMEPIIFSSIPHERFIKTCFICEENGRESKSVNGACMNCHKPGCKLSFHVTCAQSRRQLCEEASVNGHVQYVGYCTTHWTRRFKQPPLIPVNNSENAEEKKVIRKGRSRNDSTSSTNSTDMPKSRGRKQKHTDLSPDTRITIPEIKSADVSPARAEDDALAKQTQESLSNKATVPSSQAKLTDSNSNSFSVNGILTNEKLKGSSPLNTPVPIFPKQDAKISEESTEASIDNITEPVKKVDTKKRKLNEKEKGKKKPKIKVEKEERDKKKIKFLDSKKKEKSQSKDKEKVSEKKQKFPQPSRLGLVENGKVSSWESVTPKYSETPDNFQDFLEHQWNQTVHFMTSKAEHFDVASLLACLHQLKSENLKLEKKLMNAQARRDRLLGVNARLAASFTDATPDNGNGRSPLSAMLSKLNDKPDFAIPSQKDGEKAKKSPETKTLGKKRPVASPDLAMLAAASVKLESENSGKVEEGDKTNSEKTNSDTDVPLDEKPPSFNDQVNINSMLLQPTVTRHGNDSLISSSFDRLLNEHRHAYAHMNLFSDATEVDQETSSSRV